MFYALFLSMYSVLFAYVVTSLASVMTIFFYIVMHHNSDLVIWFLCARA